MSLRFHFASWGERAPDGAAACDGLVPGARIDLSHWSHNKTPAHLKADTSVEIALNFARDRAAHDVELATNNHFDSDGALAVWALLNPQLALEHAPLIIAAAECGDFDAWPSDDRGIKLEAAITRLGALDDRRAYARVLPMLDTLVPEIASGRREDLWGDVYRMLLAEEAAISRGDVSIEREGRTAIFAHAPGTRELSGPWLSRLAPAGTDRWLLAMADGSGGWTYRYELPRHAWADTVVRPRLKMPPRGIIRRSLGDAWIVKGRRGMTGIAYTEAPIGEAPLEVARRLNAVHGANAPTER